MESQDSLKHTLDYFRQQFQKKLDELRSTVQTIRQIEQALDIAAEDSSNLNLSFSTSELNVERGAPTNGRKFEIRPDEYFSKSHGEAAREYLAKIGHAVPLDELLDALISGGCKVGGVDPKRTLYTALLRNNWKDFVGVGNGFIGLRSFYPNQKSSTAAKSPPPKKAKTKQSRKGKRITQSKATTRAKKVAAKKVSPKTGQTTQPKPQGTIKQSEPSPVRTAIREVMRDGELRTAASIVQATKQKLGQSVRPISVYGTLKNGKEFMKIGNQYKLIA